MAGWTPVGDIFEAIHTEGDQATSGQTPAPETTEGQCKCKLSTPCTWYNNTTVLLLESDYASVLMELFVHK